MELKYVKQIFNVIELQVLIVPYGIEIQVNNSLILDFDFVLIVPYGIEIFLNPAETHGQDSFNRTLWN